MDTVYAFWSSGIWDFLLFVILCLIPAFAVIILLIAVLSYSVVAIFGKCRKNTLQKIKPFYWGGVVDTLPDPTKCPFGLLCILNSDSRLYQVSRVDDDGYANRVWIDMAKRASETGYVGPSVDSISLDERTVSDFI